MANIPKYDVKKLIYTNNYLMLNTGLSSSAFNAIDPLLSKCYIKNQDYLHTGWWVMNAPSNCRF